MTVPWWDELRTRRSWLLTPPLSTLGSEEVANDPVRNCDAVLIRRRPVDDELVVGGRLASRGKLPRPAASGRVVADEEEAILATMALEDDELRDHRDHALDPPALAGPLRRRPRAARRSCPGSPGSPVPRRRPRPACCRGRRTPDDRPPSDTRREAGSARSRRRRPRRSAGSASGHGIGCGGPGATWLTPRSVGPQPPRTLAERAAAAARSPRSRRGSSRGRPGAVVSCTG
jgi:hypothetical protein